MKRPARSAVKVSASVVDVAPHVRRAVAIARAGRTAIGSASAEFFADIALCPFEAVKVKVQTVPGYAKGFTDGFVSILCLVPISLAV